MAGAQTNHVALTDSERAWVREHPVVYCGVDPQWPPFSYFDAQGRACGIDADIVRLLGRRTGLNIQFVQTATWTETVRRAAAGELDFIGGIARTEQRERLLGLQFTEAYCRFPTAIVTRKDLPFMTSLAQLRTKRIALPRDYATTEELLRRYRGTQLILTTNEEQCLLMVASDQADATIMNLASASYLVHMRGISNLKISGFTELDFFLRFAARRGAPELRSILEKGLASIDSREKEEIYAGYIIPETRRAINWRSWRRRAVYSALAGFVVALVMLAWNRSLAWEIRRRKAAETAFLQARDTLETRARQLGDQAGEMGVLNQKLTWANQDLESFSSSVSHDLKAPLRRMQCFVDLIDLQAGSGLDAATRKSLGSIQEESRRMSRLIEDLLAFARIGKAEVHTATVDLERLTREVIGEMEVETRGREIIWEVGSLSQVECDRRLMKQVLANLLGNAVKFTRGRAPARIQVGALPVEPESGEAIFYVKDNGAGFEASQSGVLFEAFHRLHHREEYEGSGMGLANVKRIIQKHGGRVWAEGEAGSGATFYFSLPLKAGGAV